MKRPPRSRLTGALGVLLLATTMALAACSSNSNSGNSSGNDTGSTTSQQQLATGAPSSAQSGSAASSAPAKDSDKVLRAAYQYNPTSLDPQAQSGSYSPVALGLIFDTLIRVEPNGNLSPGLAESWKFSEDKKSLILTIRKGVTFSDGTPLDAQTVKANLDRARGINFDKSAVKGDLSSVTGVTVDGDNVVLALKDGLGGEVPAILSDRAGMIASEKSLESPDFDQHPVGAGPYKLVSFDPGAKLVVTKWDGYWDKSVPRNAGVELSFVKDSSARLRGLQSGVYDWITVDAAQEADAKTAGLHVVSGLTLSYNRITFNRSRTWFANPKVREALSYAVDRDALVQGLLFGAGAPAYQPFPDGYWGADPKYQAPTYDPDKAKALLAEAGYPNGFTFEAVCANNPGATQVAEAVAAQLETVGVHVKIRPVDNSTVTFYTNKESDAWIGPWGGRADPALTLSSQYTKGKLQNPGGTSSAAIEADAKAALMPGTQEERTPAVQAFTGQVLSENLDVFLFFSDNIQVSAADVTGVVTPVTDKPSFRGVIKS